MVKKIFKYSCCDEPPEGAIYLSSVTETKIITPPNAEIWDCLPVWHYFLVEVKE